MGLEAKKVRSSEVREKIGLRETNSKLKAESSKVKGIKIDGSSLTF
jgi:hypothetical protein